MRQRLCRGRRWLVELGLAIVEAIVVAHGGTAGRYLAPGQGTSVRVTFPRRHGLLLPPPRT